ncbi:DUF4192 domain-containing protein [Streptomyces sp. NBC_00847]|uniref:DUF4192 domain-containing protein n=1 Tax=unclassified Streptomyces TaxID=2593676 RepID=UPI0022564377|nr:DUF4192 domain-containing protein [Streptomyces sp. NBC_00847]MCX4884041.1 DUF4192 domain-containing protein [Streptomyces sp. NBC_00847]
MTNHGETTGSSDNGNAGGREDREPDDGHGESHARREMPAGPTSPDDHGGRYEHGKCGGQDAYAERPGRRPDQVDCTAYDSHGAEHQVTLRTPAELADALPYLLGYRPEDSIVLVALHDRDSRGRFGGRARLGIPTSADDWASVAEQLAHGLVTGSERRGARPEQMVAYLCQEPAKGETGRQVMERLRPLAQKLRVECGQLDVPVIEALCISDGRFWSYCCVNEACCPPAGLPMGLPGTSVLAAAATYAGLQVRGTLRELRARLLPWETAAALEQEGALDAASMALVPRILDDASRAGVAEETLEMAALIMRRLAAAPPVSGALTADLRDDELLAHDEAATLILGLQDRATRDRAAEWMEGEAAAAALRLWRALARRCVGSYGEHAAAPLTLAGWVAWSTGDELEAREALAMALGADPSYLFARLLHQACNEGLDPESIRRCLRAERKDRERTPAQPAHGGEEIAGPLAVEAVEPVPVPAPKGASRARRRGRPGNTVGNQPRSAKAGSRGSGASVPRPRTRAVGGTRPGSARTDRLRPSAPEKDAARCRDDGPGSFQPGSDSVEGEA